MRTITLLRAKQIASDFHSGQWSGLYSFASTGTITPEAITETSAEYNDSSMEVDRRGNWYTKMRYSQANRRELLSLLNYLQANQ